MRDVNLLVKPASSLCNMRCLYCFYADEASHRQFKSMGIMTHDTAERLIDRAFEATEPRGTLTFAFQGGEPTMAGLDFFRDFVAMVEKKNTHRHPILWGIQTNGLAINDEWAEFFRCHGFLVGVSVDGYPALHDRYRLDAQGSGTYSRVAESVRLLLKYKVDTNILCVVTRQTAQKARRVYRTLKSLGTGYLQFIPCLDPLEVERGSLNWSLTPELYRSFLCEVFDEWFNDWKNGHYVSVRQFDDWVHLAMGQPPSTCASVGHCGSYMVSEADGSLYPCDFYCLDEWKLGTVEQPLDELIHSDRMIAFQKRSLIKPAECIHCRYRYLCRSGCPHDWPQNGQASYFCMAYQEFFAYAEKRILQIAQAEKAALYRGGFQ